MIRNRLLPYIISLLLLVAVLVVNQRTFTKTQLFAREVSDAKDIIISFEKLSNYTKSAEIYSKANEAKSKNFYSFLFQEATDIKNIIATLHTLVVNKPYQRTRLVIIERLLHEQRANLFQKNIAETIVSGEVWRLDSLYRIHRLIKDGSNAEIKSLNEKERELNASTRYNAILTIIFSVIAFGLTASALIYNWLLARKGKWLEGFLETILNTTQNGILHFKTRRTDKNNFDFEVDFANAAVEKQLGLRPTEIIGKKLSEINFFPLNSPEYNSFYQVATSGKPAQFEMKYEKPGAVKWFYIMLAKMENGVTATMQDITDIIHNQEKLTRNIQQLEDSNTQLEQYAYVASHDLQEPLRKIMIYGGLLKEHQTNKLDEKGKTHLQKINQSAERLSILIHEILNFSSIKREKIFVETDLNFILQQVLTDLELSIEQTHTNISFTNLPTIEVIPLQISQLFFNLLVNAIKFTKEGDTPVIQITSRLPDKNELEGMDRLDHKLSYYELLVSDNGIGFNQQYARQIFGMFKRLNDKTAYPGSGIGLALCEKVVTNHNGKIFATSEEGKGTTFHIILPVKQQLNGP